MGFHQRPPRECHRTPTLASSPWPCLKLALALLDIVGVDQRTRLNPIPSQPPTFPNMGDGSPISWLSSVVNRGSVEVLDWVISKGCYTFDESFVRMAINDRRMSSPAGSRNLEVLKW